MKCLACRLGEVGEEDSYDICQVCGRENDSWGMKDNEFGGANYFSANDHRELWKLNGSRPWSVKRLNSIDRLASFIQDEFHIENDFWNGIPVADYRRVVEECKRLLGQADFDIRADIERRVRENPTTEQAKSWLYLTNSGSK